jgi:APA family basic amino acid/polyamine antiporter
MGTTSKGQLKRKFGMREAVTTAAGSVIGVGLFTTGSNVVGDMGPLVILATLVALAVSIYPAMLYAEMGAELPYAGGTYQFASMGIGRWAGVLAGWNFIVSLVSVTGGEALAFSYYFKTIFLAFGVDLPISDAALAAIVVAGFTVVNVFGVEVSGRVQNASMFFFWGVAFIWFLTMIPNVNLPSFVTTPDFISSTTPVTFFAGMCMIWWCFAGFESAVSMGEEIKYPHINIPRAMFLTPFVVFAVNALFQWFLIGITPADQISTLSTADAPFAQAMQAAGIVGFPLVLLCVGIAFGGDFSTLNASTVTTGRYLFVMARDGVVPRIFAKTSKRFSTPYVSVLTLGTLSIVLILTNSLDYIANLSLFADLFYYVIGIIAALCLRVRHPELKRAYKTPGIKVGAPVSAVIYLLMMTQLETDAFVTGVIFCVIALVVYAICRKVYGEQGGFTLDLAASGAEDEPSEEERARMDREYKVWKTVVGVACVVALLLFAFPYLVV